MNKRFTFIFTIILILSAYGTLLAQTSDTLSNTVSLRSEDGAAYRNLSHSIQAQLISEKVLVENMPNFQRTIYTAVIKPNGKLANIKKLNGSILEACEDKITKALLTMPAFKTENVSNTNKSFYLVVTIKNKTINTEIY